MKIHYMDFQVNQISIFQTAFYDNQESVFDEVEACKDEILQMLGERSDFFFYDPYLPASHEDNMKAITLLSGIHSICQKNSKSILTIEMEDIWIGLFEKEVQSRFVRKI